MRVGLAGLLWLPSEAADLHATLRLRVAVRRGGRLALGGRLSTFGRQFLDSRWDKKGRTGARVALSATLALIVCRTYLRILRRNSPPPTSGALAQSPRSAMSRPEMPPVLGSALGVALGRCAALASALVEIGLGWEPPRT